MLQLLVKTGLCLLLGAAALLGLALLVGAAIAALCVAVWLAGMSADWWFSGVPKVKARLLRALRGELPADPVHDRGWLDLVIYFGGLAIAGLGIVAAASILLALAASWTVLSML